VPRRGAVALVTTVLAVLLLFSFKPAEQTSANTLPTSAAVGGPGAPATQAPVAVGQPTPAPQSSQQAGTGGTTGTPVPPAPTATPATGGGGNASGTFTGTAINTPYGTVQIALVVQRGQITNVQLLQMPTDRQLSAQISREAGPMLVNEVLQAQNANIMGVSGASFTSYGFYESLQSALAQM
jgi:uncharacterized protein with FMN-binding domain